jgi:hypothetical protein
MWTTVCYPNVAMASKMSDVVCTVHAYMYNLTMGNTRLVMCTTCDLGPAVGVARRDLESVVGWTCASPEYSSRFDRAFQRAGKKAGLLGARVVDDACKRFLRQQDPPTPRRLILGGTGRPFFPMRVTRCRIASARDSPEDRHQIGPVMRFSIRLFIPIETNSEGRI